MKVVLAVLFGVMAVTCTGQLAVSPFAGAIGKTLWKVPTRLYTTSFAKPDDNDPAGLMEGSFFASTLRKPVAHVLRRPKSGSSSAPPRRKHVTHVIHSPLSGTFLAGALHKPVTHVLRGPQKSSPSRTSVRKPVAHVLHGPVSGAFLAGTVRKPVTHVIHSPLSDSSFPTAPRKPVARLRHHPLSRLTYAVAPIRKPVAHVLHRPLSGLTWAAAVIKPVVAVRKPVQHVSDSSLESLPDDSVEDAKADWPDLTDLDKNNPVLGSPLVIHQPVSHVLLH